MINVLKAGLQRGGIELRHSFATPADLWTFLFPSILLLGSVFFLRGKHVPGTSFSLGTTILPSSFGMGLAFAGLATIAIQLITDREDGTLLRAKATPNGMSGYLIGKVVTVGGMTLIGFVIQIIPGVFITHGLHVTAAGWLNLLWIVPLAFVATMPIGAMIGSLFQSSRSFGLVMLPLIALVAISGVFYPISALPGWLQAIGQCFPIYWLGLGMRSVFLPSAMSAVELGHSWHHLEVLGMLLLWSAIGLALAPRVLRRMARRESGSAVAQRRARLMATAGR